MKATRCANGLGRGLAWLVSLALLLALVLAASGSSVAKASPGPDSVTDSFTDETMIASKVNLAVDAGQVQLNEIFSSGLYGGGDDDYFSAVHADGNYVYAAGYTVSEGAGDYDALLVKFNISDLSIASRKVYGGINGDLFYAVYADGSYVYAAGETESEGLGGLDALLVKFDKGDLSIASRKVYGESGYDSFQSVYADGNYVYAAGSTGSEGAGYLDALLVKFDTDLNIASRIVYGGRDWDLFKSVYADSNYVYAAGYTDSEGAGESDALLVKFNIADLSILSRKVYGGTEDDCFSSVCGDGSFVYAAGFTFSEGLGISDALLVKFDTSLNILYRRVYGGGGVDWLHAVYADGSHVYAAGYTESEGAGLWDALLVKFNTGDLSMASGKVYGGADLDLFASVYADGGHIYAAGLTKLEGVGDYDALLVKFNTALAAGTAPDSCGLICQDSGLNLDDSGLTLADSDLTLADSDLTLDDSTLALGDSALSLATCFSSFSSGNLSSTNLLSGRDVSTIDSFGYNASSIPPSTGLKVQFSQDNTNWYSCGGAPGDWDTCALGSNSIDLSSLGWSGPSFYYKMEFTSDGAGTPVLDEISVTYSPTAPPPPVGGEAYPVNKLAILAPWIAVALFLAGGVGWFVLRRRRAQG